MAQISGIADDQGRIMPQVQSHVGGIAQAHHQGDAPPPERLCDLLKALQHEGEVAQIGFRVGIRQAENRQ